MSSQPLMLDINDSCIHARLYVFHSFPDVWRAGKEDLPDERRLHLILAVAAAAAQKGFHVKLLYAKTPRELRAMVIQQFRLKANALAGAEPQAKQKPFVAPKLFNQGCRFIDQ
eukprot:2117437-Pleurochrysis_carterae.AAC.1